MVRALAAGADPSSRTMAGGVPRSCSWSVTPATPPVPTHSPPERLRPDDGAHRSRPRNDHLRKRASISVLMVGARSPTRPDPPAPRSDRSPRRSLGAVWRVSSSSPARQLGAWLGRRPRSFAGSEDTGGAYPGLHTLAPPASPVPSHCSSSPEPPSPLEPACGRAPGVAAPSLSSSPSAASLPAWGRSQAAPRRPTRLVISGRAHPRRLHHTPCVTRYCRSALAERRVEALGLRVIRVGFSCVRAWG